MASQLRQCFIGTCEFCGLMMGPASGIPRNKRLQFHILRRCEKYVQTTTIPSASFAQVPVRGSAQPCPAPAPSAPPPPVPGSVRPEPVVCKKKKGTCQHTVAFGSHYDRSAFQRYQDYLSGQHATTRLPDEV